MENIIKFFQDNMIAKIILDAYLALIIVSLLIFLAFKIKKVFILLIIGIFLGFFTWISEEIGLTISSYLYPIIFGSYFVVLVVIASPEIRSLMDSNKNMESRVDFMSSSNETTKEAIADAVFNLSSTKVGALITIEQHNTLDQYAERAIQLNSDVSKELLEQIFIKDSPLHDGGVIIRGNKIICAGAY